MLDDVREAALRLLDYQDRSAGELKDRLLKKSFHEAALPISILRVSTPITIKACTV